MTDEGIFWVERHVAALPYCSEAMDLAPGALRTRVDCGAHTPSLLWRLDWQRLEGHQRAWIEGGEYLPALGFHWLERAAALMRMCARQQQATAILEVQSGRLTQLAISDLMHVMGSDAWLDDAQVALLWGFAPEALTRARPPRPLACRGAVFPCGDGLNVGWWALPADVTCMASRHS